MDDKLVKLLNDSSPKFGDWIDKINIYNQCHSFDSIDKYTEDDKVNILYEASGVLGELSELFFKYGSFKDKFDTSKMYLNIDGPSLIIDSEKTKNTFYLAIGNKGIYLNTYFRYAENLRYMDDSFYSSILSLEKLGDFELIEHEHYGRQTTEKYPGIFNNQKSKLFKIFRNYFVGTIEDGDHIFFDHFQITWPYSTDFYDLVKNSCVAFRTLYKLSYDLWKIADLQIKQGKLTKRIEI